MKKFSLKNTELEEQLLIKVLLNLVNFEKNYLVKMCPIFDSYQSFPQSMLIFTIKKELNDFDDNLWIFTLRENVETICWIATWKYLIIFGVKIFSLTFIIFDLLNWIH